MDFLENYIHENRDNFDSATPDFRLWEGINQRLNAQERDERLRTEAKIIRMPVFAQKLRIAAGVAAILTCGVVIGYFAKPQPSAIALSEVSSEHAEMERFYQTQIDKKTKQLMSLGNDTKVQADLNEIDAVMAELQQELTNAPKGSREQIIRNLIASYKAKTDILEKVVTEKSQHQHLVHNTKSDNNNNEKDTI
jgi:hypothetical protein